MISFVAPATSDYFLVNKTYTVDIEPTITREVRRLAFTAKEFPLTQSRPDGINAVATRFDFTIINLPIEEVYALDGFFNELNMVNKLVFTFPDGTLDTTIIAWDIDVSNGKFGSIQATAEKVYL